LAVAQAELAVVETTFDQLNKQKKLLKDGGNRLLTHDSELLAKQDFENPPNPPYPRLVLSICRFVGSSNDTWNTGCILHPGGSLGL